MPLLNQKHFCFNFCLIENTNKGSLLIRDKKIISRSKRIDEEIIDDGLGDNR